MRKEKRSGWNGILTSLDGSVEMSRAPLPHQEHLRQLCRMETGLLPAVLEEPLKVFSFFSLSLLTPAPHSILPSTMFPKHPLCRRHRSRDWRYNTEQSAVVLILFWEVNFV